MQQRLNNDVPQSVKCSPKQMLLPAGTGFFAGKLTDFQVALYYILKRAVLRDGELVTVLCRAHSILSTDL